GAYHHEFFVLMFAPLAALAVARISWHVMRASGRETTRAVAGSALVFLGFLAFDWWPQRHLAGRLADAPRLEAIGDLIARTVGPDDMILAGPSFFTNQGLPEQPRLPDDRREQDPHPFYFGEVSQAAFVVYDAADAERILRRARPDQRVVIVLQG